VQVTEFTQFTGDVDTMVGISTSIERRTSEASHGGAAPPAGCSVDDVEKLNQSGMRPAVRRCPR
jgi:hypothetical protein